MLRTILSIGFAQGLGLLINTVRAKIFAVLLGPAGFGVVATIDQLVLSVSQFSNLSLPFTALKFLSRDHSLGEEQFRKSYAAFLQAIVVLAIIATVIAITVIPRNLANLDPQLVKYRQPLMVALLGIPARIPGDYRTPPYLQLLPRPGDCGTDRRGLQSGGRAGVSISALRPP